MAMRFAMSEHLGQLTYGHSSASGFLPNLLTAEERNYSEGTAQKIDEEARRIIVQIHHRVHSILTLKREELHSVAEALIRKETLGRPEIEEVIAKRDTPMAANH